MGAASYKPGDIVPLSGIYRIYHDAHRLMHEATLTRGMRFPRCKQCSGQVRFTLAKSLKDDRFIPPFQPTAILEPYEDEAESGLSTAV